MRPLEKGKISGTQLMFAISCFIQGSTLLTAFVMGITQQDTWIVVILGFLASLLLLTMYMALLKRYPGKNLMEINEEVFGPILGRVFSLFYIFFFLSLASLNTRDVGNFATGFMLPETPIIFILIIFIIVCAYAVRSGVEILVRYGFVFTLMTAAVMIFNALFLLGNMNFNNFLPMLTLPVGKYIQGTHIIAIIPYGEILIFLMLASSVREEVKLGRFFFGGLSIGALSMLLIVLRDIATLGGAAPYLALPSFEAIRLINIANFMTRMEIFYAIALLVLQFFKITILYYVSVLGLCHVFRLRAYAPFVITLGFLILNYSLIVFDSSMENAAWGASTASFFSSFFELVLPGITLLVSLFRKGSVKKEALSS